MSFFVLHDLKNEVDFVVCDIPVNRLLFLSCDSIHNLNDYYIMSNKIECGPNSKFIKIKQSQAPFDKMWFVNLTRLVSFLNEPDLAQIISRFIELVQKSGGDVVIRK